MHLITPLTEKFTEALHLTHAANYDGYWMLSCRPYLNKFVECEGFYYEVN